MKAPFGRLRNSLIAKRTLQLAAACFLVWATLIPNVARSAECSSAAVSPCFNGIGFAPQADNSFANGVSADGSTVVGSSGGFNDPLYFADGIKWVDGTLLNYLSMTNRDHVIFNATDASGTIVAGHEFQRDCGGNYCICPDYRAFYREGGYILTNHRSSSATGISADGKVIVGYYDTDQPVCQSGILRPVYVRTDGTVIELGLLPGSASAHALGVSANGAVVVGVSTNSSNHREATRWVGFEPSALGFLPGHDSSEALAASADGSVVVGFSYSSSTGTATRAVRWVNGVIADLGNWANCVPAGSGCVGRATAVNSDGSVIVGQCRTADGNFNPCRWTAPTGWQLLSDLLQAQGVDFTGWHFDANTVPSSIGAWGVSADGRTMVGNAYEFGYYPQGWIARLELPASMTASTPVCLPANGSTTAFLASWIGSGTATSYRLDVSTNSTFSSYVSGYQDRNVGNVTSFSVTGLSAGQTYYYRVRSVNAVGTSPSCSVTTASTQSPGSPPAAPVATAATNNGNTGFRANWNASNGAFGYRLDVSTSNSFASFVNGYQDLNIGNIQSFFVSGLNPATTYYYRLRAYNNIGTSPNSNVISITTTSSSPSNDFFVGAFTLNGYGSTAGSNVGASRETGEPAHAGNVGGASLWWKWTPSSSGPVTFSTAGSNFNTLLAVYTGSAVNALTPVIGNDDENAGTTTSVVSFYATGGTTYYIAVDGRNGGSGAATGNIALSWTWGALSGGMVVTPSIDMVALGSQGGPFAPSSFSYRISATSGTVNWSVSSFSPPNWLTVSPTSGSADTNGTTVTFLINTNALSKAPGAYESSYPFGFSNTSTGTGGTTRNASLIVSPNACEAITKGPEFEGGAGAKGDILWRSDSGEIGIWFMNGAALSSGPGLGTVPTAWRIVATADFNGDGRSDILWRNTSTGEAAVWFISGVTVTGTVGIATVGLDWKIVGAADFNGDGKADLLWRQDSGALGVWLLNNGVYQTSGGLGTIANDWRIVGLADFNGDGKTDLLWRSSGGGVGIWLLNGVAPPTTAGLGMIPTDWRIVGVGDFSGDGKADILWRQDAGLYAMWFMNGAAMASSGTVGAVGGDWHIAGANDYNADGKADLLWRANDGSLGIWLMNGATRISSAGIGGVFYNWHVVGGEHDRPAVPIQPGPC